MAMCWLTKLNSNILKHSLLLVLSGIVFGCNTTEENQSSKVAIEINIPKFFKKEAERLNKLKPTISKTVKKDSLQESKTLKIEDWNVELASFSNIDINKAVYRGLYQKDSIANKVVYNFDNEESDITSIVINYLDDNPTTFEIQRNSENLLYQTKEYLYYDVNKGYKLIKEQHVWLLGDSLYELEGNF